MTNLRRSRGTSPKRGRGRREPRTAPWALARFAATAALLVLFPVAAAAEPNYPWLRGRTGGESLSQRIPPPPGFERIPCAEGSFTSWLRGLPLRGAGTPVRLYDGRAKSNQGGAFAVIDIDVGSSDLQQCADAVIRLRAEYLFEAGCSRRISFDFTSGHRARWLDWSAGYRPEVSGRRVAWVLRAGPDASYRSFRNYLDTVFMYAGSYSLARELTVVEDPLTVMPGDVFIRGAFPGHAVLVADVAQNEHGERVFLLVQSYMPAQDLHVLRNPASGDGPWYPARAEGSLQTPDWLFSYSELRRFPELDCP